MNMDSLPSIYEEAFTNSCIPGCIDVCILLLRVSTCICSTLKKPFWFETPLKYFKTHGASKTILKAYCFDQMLHVLPS